MAQIFINPLEGLSLLSSCSPTTSTYISTPIQVVSYPDEKPVQRRARKCKKRAFSEVNGGSDGEDQAGQNRKKGKNPEGWIANVRKVNANRGLAYKSKTGKLVEEKKIGPPCGCLMKCFEKLGHDECEKVFNNFWKLGHHDLQNSYIAGCVRISRPHYGGKDPATIQRSTRKMFVRSYFVTIKGIDTQVCKEAFINMHSISNGRLERQIKLKQLQGHPGQDARGRHGNKVNRIPEEKLNEVRRHIDGYREIAGFCGPRKSAALELLPAPLNYITMYKDYREEQILGGKNPVSEHRYRNTMRTDFNIDFIRSSSAPTPKSPRVPTVETMDILSKVDIVINKAANTTEQRFEESAGSESSDEDSDEIISADYSTDFNSAAPVTKISLVLSGHDHSDHLMIGHGDHSTSLDSTDRTNGAHSKYSFKTADIISNGNVALQSPEYSFATGVPITLDSASFPAKSCTVEDQNVQLESYTESYETSDAEMISLTTLQPPPFSAHYDAETIAAGRNTLQASEVFAPENVASVSSAGDPMVYSSSPVFGTVDTSSVQSQNWMAASWRDLESSCQEPSLL